MEQHNEENLQINDQLSSLDESSNLNSEIPEKGEDDLALEKEIDLPESYSKEDTNNEIELDETFSGIALAMVENFIKKIEDSALIINDEHDPEIEAFINGFNDASFLMEYETEHMTKIKTTLETNEYNTGFQAVKIYHEKEKELQQIDELGKLRLKSRDRENEREL